MKVMLHPERQTPIQSIREEIAAGTEEDRRLVVEEDGMGGGNGKARLGWAAGERNLISLSSS